VCVTLTVNVDADEEGDEDFEEEEGVDEHVKLFRWHLLANLRGLV
jgi:hypothetical protein